jgi:hypothetical protein
MQSIPCFLCGRRLQKRMTKRSKPFFLCDPCGIQLFIRRKQGIERLEEFFRSAEEAQVPFQQHAQNFHRMQAILKEIADVQGEIKRIGISHYFSDQKYRIRKSLGMRLKVLFSLEEFCGVDKERSMGKKSESSGR